MASSSAKRSPQVITCKGAVAWEAGETLVMEEVEVNPPQPLEIQIKVFCTSCCRSHLTAWQLGMYILRRSLQTSKSVRRQISQAMRCLGCKTT